MTEFMNCFVTDDNKYLVIAVEYQMPIIMTVKLSNGDIFRT